MTPHHEERAIWRGDGGRPSAIGVWVALGFLSWTLVAVGLHITGVVSWFG